MDKYIRNVKVIRDAFEQIKDQTGINSIEEIVTTFIKAEEQNYSLFNYVNKLNSDIDTFEEQNKNFLSEIEKQEQKMKDSEDRQEKDLEHIKNEVEVGKFNMEQKQTEIDKRSSDLKSISGNVEKLISAFSRSSLLLSVAQPMQYGEDFNDKNAI